MVKGQSDPNYKFCYCSNCSVRSCRSGRLGSNSCRLIAAFGYLVHREDLSHCALYNQAASLCKRDTTTSQLDDDKKVYHLISMVQFPWEWIKNN